MRTFRPSTKSSVHIEQVLESCLDPFRSMICAVSSFSGVLMFLVETRRVLSGSPPALTSACTVVAPLADLSPGPPHVDSAAFDASSCSLDSSDALYVMTGIDSSK